MTPHIDPNSSDFPGDPTEQKPFGFFDSLRSAVMLSYSAPHLAMWSWAIRSMAKYTSMKNVDWALKAMGRSMTATLGVRVKVSGTENLDLSGTYVYVVNHVNVLDLFVLYQAIPQYTRALELVDHFSWPIIGPLLVAANQIPIDPDNPRKTARSLKAATKMLKNGESLTVLPEGSRTLDGSLGHFFQGAFKLAIDAGVPVVPIAIRGGRTISRRGDWRLRPGVEEVIFGAPISTEGFKKRDATKLAKQCRCIIIDLLHGRRAPGN